MIVNPSQNFAWCFACQNGGDIFAFVQKIEGIDFPESVKLIAEIAGVDSSEFFKNQTPQSQEKKKEKKEYSERLREVLEESQKFFLEQFKKNNEAQKYVFEQRKFIENTQKKFGIGFAPDDFHALEKHLLAKKFSRKEMLDAGVLAQKDEKGEQTYDKFRKRVMFPALDALGKICGFGGRILGDGDPKYLNSPETILYEKSKNLFGFSFARDRIRKDNMAILVEGNLDVMTCHEKGIFHAVGVSGTGFSKEQAKLLKRFCTRVTLALDGDDAGMKATERILEVLLEENFSLRIMEIPGGKDPDESIRSDTQKFVEALVGAQSALFVIANRLVKKHDISGAEGKKKVFEEIFPLISKVQEPIEKEEALNYLSTVLKTNIDLIKESFQKFIKSQHKPFQEQQKNTPQKKNDEISLPDFFWGTVFAFFSESEKIFELIEKEFFLEKEEKTLYERLKYEYTTGREFLKDEVLQTLNTQWQENIQKSILFVEDKIAHFPLKQRKTEIKRIAIKMGKYLLETQIKNCTHEIQNDPSPEKIEQLQSIRSFLQKFHS
jgi:DNA primase